MGDGETEVGDGKTHAQAHRHRRLGDGSNGERHPEPGSKSLRKALQKLRVFRHELVGGLKNGRRRGGIPSLQVIAFAAFSVISGQLDPSAPQRAIE